MTTQNDPVADAETDSHVKQGKTISGQPILAMCDEAGIAYKDCAYAEITVGHITFYITAQNGGDDAPPTVLVRCPINWNR